MQTTISDDPIFNKAHNRFSHFTKDDILLEQYENQLKCKWIGISILGTPR